MPKGYTPKITPIKPAKLIKIFEAFGLKQYPPSGGSSHIPMKRNPSDTPIVIVNHPSKETKPNAIKGLLKKAGITKAAYLDKYHQL